MVDLYRGVGQSSIEVQRGLGGMIDLQRYGRDTVDLQRGPEGSIGECETLLWRGDLEVQQRPMEGSPPRGQRHLENLHQRYDKTSIGEGL